MPSHLSTRICLWVGQLYTCFGKHGIFWVCVHIILQSHMYHACDTLIQLRISIELTWNTLTIGQGYWWLSRGKSLLLSRCVSVNTSSQGHGVDSMYCPSLTAHFWELSGMCHLSVQQPLLSADCSECDVHCLQSVLLPLCLLREALPPSCDWAYISHVVLIIWAHECHLAAVAFLHSQCSTLSLRLIVVLIESTSETM